MIAKNFQYLVISAFLLISSCAANEKQESRNTDNNTIITESVSDDKDDNSDLSICSFNIQFLGNFKKRDDEALSNILKDYDIVLIQELVAPPVKGVYPDGTEYKADAESSEFFVAMDALGFSYVLSEEDTGAGEEIHKASSATEWWVAFYKPEKVKIGDASLKGFLAEDRSNHADYERVPYAFSFQTTDDAMDFVLISVHLQPGAAKKDKARRKHELDAIAQWIDNHDDKEKDFIILGDMNIENKEELADATPTGFLSLNDECRFTNTNLNKRKPYDHVMYNISSTASEIDLNFDLQVIDLISVMKPFWKSSEPYPGEPYEHNLFKQYYSDHHPVVFKMLVSESDDD